MPMMGEGNYSRPMDLAETWMRRNPGKTLEHFFESMRADGFTPSPVWRGTALAWTTPEGSETKPVDLKGDPGETPTLRTEGHMLQWSADRGQTWHDLFDMTPPAPPSDPVVGGKVSGISVNIGSVGNGAVKKTIAVPGIKAGDIPSWSVDPDLRMPGNVVIGGAECPADGQVIIHMIATGLLAGISMGTIKVSVSWH